MKAFPKYKKPIFKLRMKRGRGWRAVTIYFDGIATVFPHMGSERAAVRDTLQVLHDDLDRLDRETRAKLANRAKAARK